VVSDLIVKFILAMKHIDRKLFQRSFESESLPEWTCPQCNVGKLIAKEGSIKKQEYRDSLSAREHDEWEPFWIRGNFSGRLICNSEKCGGTMIVAGEMSVETSYDAKDGMGYVELFVPKYFDPPLKVLHVNFGLP